MANRRPLTVVLLLLAGCSRSFPQPSAPIPPTPPQLLPLGVECSDAGLCSSGSCGDGVCCEGACAPDSICNAVGHAGHCTPRELGAACSGGAQCPTGFCVDGVCCNELCGEICRTCIAGVQPGLCDDQPENTDPHGDCSFCSACYGGACGPARVGSNPHPTTDCPGELVCGVDQACHAPGGSGCQSNTDCATGTCILGVCRAIEVEELSAGLSPAATERSVLGVAETAAGDVAVAIDDFAYQGPTLQFDALSVLYRRDTGPWTPALLYNEYDSSSQYYALAQPLFLGRTLYVAAFRPASDNPDGSCGPGHDACGVSLIPISPDGVPGTAEAISTSSQAVDSLSSWALRDGSAEIAFSDESGFHFVSRSAEQGHALTSQQLPTPSGYALGTFAAGKLHGAPAFIYWDANASQIIVVKPDGSTVAALGVADVSCADADPRPYSPRGQPVDDALRFTVACPNISSQERGESFAISVDPAAGPPQVVSMHDGTLTNGLGTLAEGPTPKVAFVHYDGAVSADDFVSLSAAAGGEPVAIYNVIDSTLQIHSLDVGVSSGGLSVVFSTTHSNANADVPGARTFLVRVTP